MHLILFVYAAITLVAVQIVYALYRDQTSPLRKIDGPLITRFSRIWYLRSIWAGHAHEDNIQLHQRYAKPGEHYAPIVRLGPNLYSITRPEKAVYGIGSKMPKSSWYDGWKHPSPDRWTLFPDRNIQRHADTRRKFQSLYSLSSLLQYEQYVDETQHIFQQRLTEMTTSSKIVDIHHWLQCYAFDVIGNITYGRRFGFLDEGKDVQNCMASLQSVMVYSTLVGVYVWAHPVLYKIMEKLPASGAAGRTYIMKVVREAVDQRKIERSELSIDEKKKAIDTDGPRDFLNLMMDAQEDPKKGVTSYHTLMMCLSNIIAGSDTTAVSLSSVMYHLTKEPRAMAALRSELDQAVQDGRMSPDRVPFKEALNLPYLQACIKEGLRLHPATGLPLWREVPKGGVQMMGQYFPEGTEVGLNTWVAHYDQDIWGSDANQFRPERWIEALENNQEELKAMDNHFLPVSDLRFNFVRTDVNIC